MNVGDTVYVRWYGSVVEGEVVDNEKDNQLLGAMVAVRIPLQGMHATALFFPEHVHQTAEELLEQFPKKEQPVTFHVQPDNIPEPEELPRIETSVETISVEDWDKVMEFKEAHWDHEHNHLQVEALDEFYELWKAYSKPLLVVPEITESNIEKIAEEFANYDGRIYVADAEPTILLESNKEPVSQNDTAPEKPKKSNPTITQLSLFD